MLIAGVAIGMVIIMAIIGAVMRVSDAIRESRHTRHFYGNDNVRRKSLVKKRVLNCIVIGYVVFFIGMMWGLFW